MTLRSVLPPIITEKTPEKKKNAAKEKKEERSRRLSLPSGPLLSLAIVVALLAAAFLVRIWGVQFGLPFLFHPDEQAIIERAIVVMGTGDYNPHWFHYPSLYIYIQTISNILVYLGMAAKVIENIALPTTAAKEYVEFGRVTTAAMGTLTVLTVYYAGRSLVSEKVGLIGAALLSFSLLHTIHSHYITTDVPMTLFTTLSFLMSVFVFRSGGIKYYILAGLTAGLAASTKYNGAIALISLIAAHSFVAWRTRSLVNIPILAGAASFFVGFLIGTPYALLDLPEFLKDFAFEIAHYRSGQPGFEGTNNLFWYLGSVWGSWDAVMLLFTLAGAVVCLATRRAAYLLLLVFPAIYFWWFSNFIVRFERNLVPLTPFMALLAAVLIEWLAAKIALLRPSWRFINGSVVVMLSVAGIVPSLIGIVQFDRLLSDKPSKTAAAEWANSNLPHGSRIAVEHYGIPLDPNSFELVNVLTLSNYDATWFTEQKFDYVILSDGVWRRFYLEPDKYRKEIAALDSIFAKFKLVKAFEPVAPSSRLVSYPTVDVYHLPYVRIYQVSGIVQ